MIKHLIFAAGFMACSTLYAVQLSPITLMEIAQNAMSGSVTSNSPQSCQLLTTGLQQNACAYLPGSNLQGSVCAYTLASDVADCHITLSTAKFPSNTLAGNASSNFLATPSRLNTRTSPAPTEPTSKSGISSLPTKSTSTKQIRWF